MYLHRKGRSTGYEALMTAGVVERLAVNRNGGVVAVFVMRSRYRVSWRRKFSVSSLRGMCGTRFEKRSGPAWKRRSC